MDIYKITDLETGLAYIGRTTRDVRFRIAEHKYRSSLIGKAIKEKGLQAFSVEIIAHSEDYAEGKRLERFWIERLNTFYPNGYNLADGDSKYGSVNPFYGRKHTAETLLKECENQKRRREVIDLQTGARYKSIRSCAKHLGITKTHVSRLCKGECAKSKFKLRFV